MKKPRRSRPVKLDRTAYSQLWSIVDGAVRDCFRKHPSYIGSRHHEYTVRVSVVKRVVGAVNGFAVQAARRRSLRRAAENAGSPAPHVSVATPETGEPQIITAPPIAGGAHG